MDRDDGGGRIGIVATVFGARSQREAGGLTRQQRWKASRASGMTRSYLPWGGWCECSHRRLVFSVRSGA